MTRVGGWSGFVASKLKTKGLTWVKWWGKGGSGQQSRGLIAKDMAKKQEKPEAYGIEAEDLSPRQADILRLVVDTYIEGGQPVSSLGLVDRYDVGLSSASIRHILSDLEKYGYLYGPHRSSGRVPTEKAYRFYVASLSGRLPPANFAEEKQRFIQKEYLRREFSIRRAMR